VCIAADVIARPYPFRSGRLWVTKNLWRLTTRRRGDMAPVKEKGIKIPIRALARPSQHSRGQNDPDAVGAAQQSVAVELVLVRGRREGRAGWQLGV